MHLKIKHDESATPLSHIYRYIIEAARQNRAEQNRAEQKLPAVSACDRITSVIYGLKIGL